MDCFRLILMNCHWRCRQGCLTFGDETERKQTADPPGRYDAFGNVLILFQHYRKINEPIGIGTYFQVSMSQPDWTNLFLVLAFKIQNNLNNPLAGIALAEHLPLLVVRIK